MRRNRTLSVSIPISVQVWMDKFIEEFNKANPDEPTNRSEFIVNAIAKLLKEIAPLKTEKAD